MVRSKSVPTRALSPDVNARCRRSLNAFKSKKQAVKAPKAAKKRQLSKPGKPGNPGKPGKPGKKKKPPSQRLQRSRASSKAVKAVKDLSFSGKVLHSNGSSDVCSASATVELYSRFRSGYTRSKGSEDALCMQQALKASLLEQ